MVDTQRSPRSNTEGPAAADDHDTPFVTSSGPSFTWAECDAHPWLRASVILVTDAEPYCVPPEGAGHYISLVTP